MDIQKLKGHIPDVVLAELPEIMTKYEINTPKRLSHFLAQASHESGGFKTLTENLNYSSDGLLKTFPKYFTKETAVLYARKPEKIANKVYANRMSNLNESSGDGYKFRGRGYLQVTGKDNYKALSESVGVDFISKPELVVTPKYALMSAAWFFKKNNLIKKSDTATVEQITKSVNGGTIGLEHRLKEYDKFIKLLS